jgi:hypothetical protein
MKPHYYLFQEDRVFLEHVERGLLALLKRLTNKPAQTEAIAALLSGLWNLPFITPGLSCAIEYCPTEAAMRFEINEEFVSFSYGSNFHASFWAHDTSRHVGSRWGESTDPIEDYHSWKVFLEMFENDMSDGETPFTTEYLSAPTLAASQSWGELASWKSRGVDGITEIQS